ncbi:MAG TPA: ATP-grasp domain-containing protein [Vagococcus sp.]|uniref:Phosphoribosylaminoimidazole carboxylase ATPase subunit n=2 Tax=Enterococcaceae TaxID=81852 RepID=A0A1X6WQD2_9ENTE|nr:Phosphoribosylaminoimidazole carboxylase ATPase subunit [Vagococcus fluvialis bH819]HCM90698.1 ATP-grasp domain-containing protein [Vagococcus sp.]
MLVMSAKKYGYKVGILDPLEESPASQVADWHIVANYNEENALLELAKKSDILTFETENIDTRALDFLEKYVKIPQGTLGLSVTQDRLLEREFLDNHSINIAPYETAVVISDIKDAANSVGYPCIVKSTRRYGEEEYIVKINNASEVDLAVPLIQQGVCMVEAFVELKKELFMTIAVNSDGEYTLFPIVESYHYSDGLLKKVKAPIEIDGLDQQLVNQIELISKVIASELNICGIVGIEFFITKDNNLYVNEISTRPHESSTYTIDACDFSEYDAHIRGICNWALPKIKQFMPAVTINITKENYALVNNLLTQKRKWHYHFYQYPKNSDRFKLGHITVLSDNLEETIQEIKHVGLIDN